MNIKERILERYKRGGLFGILFKFFEVPLRAIKNFFLFLFLNVKPKKQFVFLGEHLLYLYHWYNTTWVNERTVEIPIVRAMIEKYKRKKILEIGNTLDHYFSFSHDVIDKYEVAPGVINEDIIDFKPKEKYDLIISISTMEHVGWDEEVKEKEKILKAFLNLRENYLALGGTIFVTMPLGYNPFLDELLKKKSIPFTEKYFLKRISKRNEWIQLDFDKGVENIKYGAPFRNANGIIIGIIR